MDLFEKVKNVRNLKETIEKEQNQIKVSIKKQFIEVGYHMEINDKVPYKPTSIGERDGIVKVAYPVLDIPNGYSKENETFLYYCDQFQHRYELKDQKGRIIKILSVSYLGRFTSDIKLFPFSREVHYKVEIFNETYVFDKEFDYEPIEQLVKDKIQTSLKERNAAEEDRYQEYLKKIAKTEKMLPLKDIKNGFRMDIEPNIIIFFNINKSKVRNSENYNREVEIYLKHSTIIFTRVEIIVSMNIAHIGRVSQEKFVFEEMEEKAKS